MSGAQAENMLDFEVTGAVARVLKATYRSKEVKERDFTKFFQDLSLFLHAANGSADIPFNNPELMIQIDGYVSFLEKLNKGGVFEIKYESCSGIRTEYFDVEHDKDRILRFFSR